MSDTTLVAQGIRKSFKGRTVVNVDRLELQPGRTLALLGPSGSGKSTLLSIVGLLERPDEGQITIDGKRADTHDRTARMTMAAVFQRAYLFKGTVGDNVAYGLKLRSVPREEIARRVDSALERVGLGGWEKHSALRLSGGEAQRVALARALVLEPRVLLLDEPLASLDPIIKWRLARDFSRILHEEGVTTLYVTHDQDEALAVADDVAIMRDGRIVARGRADEVFGVPVDEWTAGFLGMEPPLDGVVIENVDGVARIDCGGTDLYAVSSAEPGTSVHVGVRPEDVLLFEAAADLPVGSARNRIDGVIAEIAHSGATYRVVVEHGGMRIASKVSRAALSDLHLEVGVTVTMLFKASAVRVAFVST